MKVDEFLFIKIIFIILKIKVLCVYQAVLLTCIPDCN